YVTNVVKHFKFERRGKLRIHKKPNAEQVHACFPWLEADRGVVQPRVLVLLGATAAQALLGSSFRVSRQRGEFLDSDLAPRVLATVHPSSILRPPEAVARYLALWMSYEDAVRVADLKTRASRFARIRASARAGDGAIVVTDYLKPDLDEIWGVLPDRLVRPLARWAERRWPHGRPTVGQHVRTTTISGFLRVWLLARLKGLRPTSYSPPAG